MGRFAVIARVSLRSDVTRSARVTAPVNPVSHVGKLRLLVVADHAVRAIHTLPATGSVTIGRGEDNTIQIDDESISRRHAVLRLDPVMTVEDVGSSNGTKI